MEKKICFVVMGFGKKMDYRNSKEVDLDIIYHAVIKPLFSSEFPEYEIVRADEIAGSDIIDVSMYMLLMKADLVIADITTLNENAIYELGVRHALRPFSTVIMLQESEKMALPFDLSHCRILTYRDFGERLEPDGALEIQSKLKQFVIQSRENKVDSPFYTYLPDIKPPLSGTESFEKLAQNAKDTGEKISELVERAQACKKESNFQEAAVIWEKLSTMLPANSYVVQQLALAVYKSKYPNETVALENALGIIRKLHPETSLDLETLGITAAVYKHLYMVNGNYDYLDEAVRYYKKGYIIKNDYYNGENYVNCLILKTKKNGLDTDEITYLRFEIRKTCQEILAVLKARMKLEKVHYWMYATYAACSYYIGDMDAYQKYDKLFTQNCQADWELKSYQENFDRLKQLIQGSFTGSIGR